MTLPAPDLVIPFRIGPARSARIADWLDARSDFDVQRRLERGFIGVRVETSSCRNLIIRTNDDITNEDTIDLLRRTLRRTADNRIDKDCQVRIRRDLSCIADLAHTSSVNHEPSDMVARTTTPFGTGGVLAWTRTSGRRRYRRIVTEEWSWNPPSILCVHGDRDVTLTCGEGSAERQDDPLTLMRSLARARALIDDPANNPWILPTDETPR